MTTEKSQLEQFKLRTSEEVADRLGQISATTVRRLAKQGKLGYVKGARRKSSSPNSRDVLRIGA